MFVSRKRKSLIIPIIAVFVLSIALQSITFFSNAAAISDIWNFTYTGDVQNFAVPVDGVYKLEVWGAAGARGNSNTSDGGRGGYCAGQIYLTTITTIGVYVGGAGKEPGNITGGLGGYNGGGNGGSDVFSGGGGGGATDIRSIGNGLNNRIIVAGGGGGTSGLGSNRGGAGGGIAGIEGGEGEAGYGQPGSGGTQSAGGSACTSYTAVTGYLGFGGAGGAYRTNGGGGGGGGYFGGGGGSSCNNIEMDNSSTPQVYYYAACGGGGSGYVGGVLTPSSFNGNTSFPSPDGGNEIGHPGNGYARITLISLTPSTISAKVGDKWTYETTGTCQTLAIPVDGTYKLEVWGASGGKGSENSIEGGRAGYSAGQIYLTTKSPLNIFVGEAGTNGGYYTSGLGGYNGGEKGGSNYYSGGGGGGATDIRVGTTDINNRIIVAGGGGGTAGYNNGDGGFGGGTSGIAGKLGIASSGQPGNGGTQSSGGTAYLINGATHGSNIVGGIGGTFDKHSGGGGGGGFYGGGGGSPIDSSTKFGAGGGGGSGYVGGVSTPTTIAGDSDLPSPSGGIENGHSGNGYAKITLISLDKQVPTAKIGDVWNFNAIGAIQIFVAPTLGIYKLEVWGAQGGTGGYSNNTKGGLGGYSVGQIFLDTNTTLNIAVGENGVNGGFFTPGPGGYNGGGNSGGYKDSYRFGGGGGGGATDIRLASAGISSRVIVAGGGGGASGYNKGNGGGGGGDVGLNGEFSINDGLSYGMPGAGGSQSSGGSTLVTCGALAGSMGVGGTGGAASYYSGGGGGGGYYGGGGGAPQNFNGYYTGGGGGGSGYIGGVLKASTLSGEKSFPSPKGLTETGHAGNGFARITLLAIPITFSNATLAANNSYVDITFTNGVYNSSGKALKSEDLTLTLNPNNGNATNAKIYSLSTTDGKALSGGEKTIRVNLDITGMPKGTETITIKPTNETSIYDSLNCAMATKQITNTLTLNPLPELTLKKDTVIKIISSALKDDTAKVYTINLTNTDTLIAIASSLITEVKNSGYKLSINHPLAKITIPQKVIQNDIAIPTLSNLILNIEAATDSNILNKIKESDKFIVSANNFINFELKLMDSKGNRNVLGNLSFPIEIDIQNAQNYSIPAKTSVFNVLPTYDEKGTLTTVTTIYCGGYLKDKSIKFYPDHLNLFIVMERNMTFKDVSAGWAKNAIEILSSRKIISGYKDEFSPLGEIKRVDFSILTNNVLGKIPDTYTHIFKDIDSTDYFSRQIINLDKFSILDIKGGTITNPTTFGVYDSSKTFTKMTREKAAIFIINGYKYIKTYNSELVDNKTTFKPFADMSSASANAIASINEIASLGIMKGYPNGNFEPQKTITRQEVAQLFLTFLLKTGNMPPI